MPFLFLGLDLPAAPLYKDVMETNIIPQVPCTACDCLGHVDCEAHPPLASMLCVYLVMKWKCMSELSAFDKVKMLLVYALACQKVIITFCAW